MPRMFRITYIRTAYCEIDIAAEDCHEAEGRFEAIAAALPEELDQRVALIKPQHRIVDVVAADDVDRQPTDGRQQARVMDAARAAGHSRAIKPAA